MPNYANNMRYGRSANPHPPRSGCGAVPAPRPEPRHSDCDSCRRYAAGSEDMVIAMAYVPWQKWRKIYEAGKGLQQGTIFEELDKPFLGGGCCR